MLSDEEGRARRTLRFLGRAHTHEPCEHCDEILDVLRREEADNTRLRAENERLKDELDSLKRRHDRLVAALVPERQEEANDVERRQGEC